MEKKTQGGVRAWFKGLTARAMRPGLSGVQRRLDRIESHLGIVAASAAKYREELQYWRWFVKRGGCEKQHGEPFEQVFGRWQRHRLLHLGAWLGVPAGESEGNIDDWCKTRSVVEIGAGPYPAVAAARHGWRRCVAIDPLAKGYVEEGLLPPACESVVYIDSPGERIPLPAEFADLVIIENCLDHVSDPAAVVTEMRRLLKPGGHLWFFVDLSNHVDHMHPHAMNEERVRKLLAAFECVREEITPIKAHPKAYAGFRALFRKPVGTATPAVDSRAALGPKVQIMTRSLGSNGKATGAAGAKAQSSVT